MNNLQKNKRLVRQLPEDGAKGTTGPNLIRPKDQTRRKANE